MVSPWVPILGLIFAIIALALGIGLIIWMFIFVNQSPSTYTVQKATGTATEATSGGGNMVFINQSTSTSEFLLKIQANGSATAGKFFYIVNTGQGTLKAEGPTGSSVTFPTTTLAKGASAQYVLSDTNVYIRVM